MKNLDERPQELEQYIWDKLFDAARFAKMNNQEKLAYIKEMNTVRDLRNQIEYAAEEGKAEGLTQGKAEGLAQGKAEEKVAIAKSLKAEGVDISIISRTTGLPIEEINIL